MSGQEIDLIRPNSRPFEVIVYLDALRVLIVCTGNVNYYRAMRVYIYSQLEDLMPLGR